MNRTAVLAGIVAAHVAAATVAAQTQDREPAASRYVDEGNGLTLDAAIRSALEREPSLRAARSRIEGALGLLEQATRRSNPSASFEERREPGGSDRQTAIGVEWPLDLRRIGSRRAVAEHELAAARHAASDRERLIAGEVRVRFGDVLEGLRSLELLDGLVAAVRRQHELLVSRVEEGASPPLERDLFGVELRRLEADRMLQEAEVESALFLLKPLLGLPADEPLTIGEALEAVVVREGATQLPAPDESIDTRADLLEAAAMVRTAAAAVARARAEGGADMSVFGSYMRMDGGFPQQAFTEGGALTRIRGRFNYVSAGVQVSVPLLDRNQGEVAAARAAQAGATAEYDALRLAAAAELAAARARDERTRHAAALYRTGVLPLARRNLGVVEQTYDAGRLTAFDVLDERRRYLEIERSYTEALRATYDARSALHLALGVVR